MKLLLLLIAVVMFAACGKSNSSHNVAGDQKKGNTLSQSPEKWTDTLTYVSKGADSTMVGCKDGTNCPEASVRYFYFNNQPKLNKRLAGLVAEQIEVSLDTIANLDAAIKNYVSDYITDQDSLFTDSNDFARAMTDDFNVDILKQDSSFIVLEIRSEHTGGAHPLSNFDYLNWDTKKDAEVTLDDLFVKGYEDSLTAIAEKIFRKDEGLKPHESLENYSFENGRFALSDNFKILPKGITFFYNQSEIKAYFEGPVGVELLIPYQSIKHLLRANTVVSRYIK